MTTPNRRFRHDAVCECGSVHGALSLDDVRAEVARRGVTPSMPESERYMRHLLDALVDEEERRASVASSPQAGASDPDATPVLERRRALVPDARLHADAAPFSEAERRHLAREIELRHPEVRLDEKSDGFVRGLVQAMRSNPAAVAAATVEASARSRARKEDRRAARRQRDAAPLPSSIDAHMTAAERELPPHRRPLPSELAARRDEALDRKA
jgi:hypothetical protein